MARPARTMSRAIAGALRTLAEAAQWRTGIQGRRADASMSASYCERVKAASPSSAAAKCVNSPSTSMPGRARTRPAKATRSSSGRPCIAEDEDGCVDAADAKLFALIDADNAQARGAGVERGAAHGDSAVAVGVGLHDGEEARGGGAGGEQPHVVRDGVEVDLGPAGAAGPVVRAGVHGGR